MKILIAVPSKNRAEILLKNALPWMREMEYDWKIFVEPQDFENYRKILEESNIITLPENDKGYGYAKFCIKKYAIENGYDAIFKMDDDIKGWTDFRKTLSPKESAEKIKYVIEQSIHIFNKYHNVSGISFPYSFQMFDQYDFKKSKRVQTAYLFRTDDFYADERISNFDDFAMSIRSIINSKIILMCGMTGIVLGVKVGGGDGGQQDFDRLEQSKKEAKILQELCPLLKFRAVEKRWGTEPDLRSLKIGFYL